MARLIKQAEPMTPVILWNVFKYVNIKEQEQLAAWVAALYSFHLLLRKSNLVPESGNKFDPCKQLTHDRLVMAPNAMLVDIVWCKNMQYREKRMPLPLVCLKDQDICPVFWTWKMLKSIPAKPTDPVFCYHRDGEFMVLTYLRFTTIFREWLEKAGYDKTGFSSHSYRRGGTSYLYDADVPGPETVVPPPPG